MAVQVEQHGREPILLVMFRGDNAHDAIAQMYAMTDDFLKQTAAPHVWRLIDLSQCNITFADVMGLVRNTYPDLPGSLADPRITSMFYTPDPMARLTSDLLQKQGVHVPVLPGLGEALIYAQELYYGMAADTGA